MNSLAVIRLKKTNQRIVIQDFSRMGLGFISENTLQIKTFISIVYQNEINQIIQMQSYIKHIRKLRSGLWYIGVQFVGIESKFDREA